MNVDFPFRFEGGGVTAATSDDDHIRDLIEQVLFTAPGERLNRPSFGSGLLQLAFAPNSAELAAAARFLVQGALQQWLGDLIQTEAVEVEADDGRLTVSVTYTVRRDQRRQQARFTRGA